MDTIWRSARKFLYKRVLHADDSPHRIALGVAIATFIAFTPTMGLQTVIALGLAALLRANKAVCIPIVWITNPFTFVPIYGTCWWLGAMLLGSPNAAREAVLMQLQQGGHSFFAGFFTGEFWRSMLHLMVEMGGELWLGCILVGVFAGVCAYFVTRSGVVTYRNRRHERMMHKHERRRQRQSLARKKVVHAGEAL